MRHITLMLSLLALAATACGGGGASGRAGEILALQRNVTAGQAVYVDNCETCHGVDLHGSSDAPNLVDVLHHHTDAEVVQALLEGEGTDMPSFEKTLVNQDIANLLGYLRSAH